MLPLVLLLLLLVLVVCDDNDGGGDGLNANTSAMTVFVTITKNPPATTLTIRDRHILVTPGCSTTHRLPQAMHACSIIDEHLRPNNGESTSEPTNGDNSSSMDAEVEERMDNSCIARASGWSSGRDDDDDFIKLLLLLLLLLLLARWRVIDGNGENMTMDTDAAMRNDV